MSHQTNINNINECVAIENHTRNRNQQKKKKNVKPNTIKHNNILLKNK